MLLVKRLTPSATLPSRAHPEDIGLDLCADLKGQENIRVYAGGYTVIPTGLSLSFSRKYYGRIAPRSGLAAKHGVTVLGGVIDSNYRGEVNILLSNSGHSPIIIKHGQRIAQLIMERADIVDVMEVESLDETDRGDGGFGSTGS